MINNHKTVRSKTKKIKKPTSAQIERELLEIFFRARIIYDSMADLNESEIELIGIEIVQKNFDALGKILEASKKALMKRLDGHQRSKNKKT